MTCLMLLQLGGCSTYQNLFREKIPLKTLEIKTAVDVNGGFPVPMDTLFVYDKDLFNELIKLSSEQWFQSREKFISLPTDKLSIVSTETIPDTTLLIMKFPANYQYAIHVLIFADILGSGDHKVLLPKTSEVVAKLTSSGISVQKK